MSVGPISQASRTGIGANAIALISCLLLVCSATLGQVRRDQFVHWTTENGLSSNRLYTVVQDSIGFIWIGTLQGLNRYDGNSFRVYTNQKNDTNSLSNNVARVLFVDSKGVLWIGTEGGLNRFSDSMGTFTRYLHDPARGSSLSSNLITALCEAKHADPPSRDRVSAIWVGTKNAGLNRFLPSTTTFIRFRRDALNPKSLRSDSISALAADSAGRLWVGTNRGVDLFDEASGNFVHVPQPISTARQQLSLDVSALRFDHAGMLWVGTSTGDLFTFDVGTAQWRAIAKLRDRAGSEVSIYSIVEQKNRFVWIATSNGLKRLDRRDGSWTFYEKNENDPKSLPGNFVRSLIVDRSENLWAVTDSKLSMLSNQRTRFQKFVLNENKESDQTVSALLSREEGEVWIGSENDGIYIAHDRAPSDKSVRLAPTNVLQSRTRGVTAFFQARNGTIWVGWKDPYTLAKFDERRRRFTHHFLGLRIYTIAEDRNAMLWLGTSGGIRGFDQNTNAFVNDLDTLFTSTVSTIARSKDGSMWIGGGKHVLHWNPALRTARRYPMDDDVYSLHEDASGTLWVGSFSGFGHLDKSSGAFTQYSVIPNVNTVVVYNITEDFRGRLWLGTFDHGLVRFDPRDTTFDNYTEGDGLLRTVFTKASTRTATGELIVGGRGGFTRFHPDSITKNPYVPTVRITRFHLANDSAGTQYPRGYAFDHTQNYFVVEFAALEFTNPSRNRFLYRMKPTDEWVNPLQRSLMIPNLGDDNYVLEVKASNNDGMWSAESAVLPFRVKPPFTKTWYFYACIMLLISGLITGAYKYRINQLLAIERMRMRIASDLHDDVGSSMSGIALRVDLVKAHIEKDSKDHQHLATAVASTRKTQDKLRDIVSFINPEHDNPEYIVLRMKEVAGELLLNHKYTFDSPPGGIPTAFNMEFRWNLHLIYKEILNNIVKSARASNVAIRLGSSAERFTMSIADDGIGFDLEEAKRKGGNGLLNLTHRAEKIGATIEFRTSPGNGTTVVLHAKIPRLRYGKVIDKFVSYVTNNSRHNHITGGISGLSQNN